MRTLLLTLLVLTNTASNAQSSRTPEDDVLLCIDRFFAAMEQRDTALMASTLVRDGAFHVVATDGAKPVLTIPHSEYLKRLADSKDKWVERYWNEFVRIDGSIATVSAEYDFHVNGQLSHCGTDVFLLVKDPEGWRIASIAFDRKIKDCKPGPMGPLK